MKKTIEDVLTEYDVVLEYGCGTLPNGRPIRYLTSAGLIEIGDADFDRWANSVEEYFDVWLPKGLRAFERYLKALNTEIEIK
jgi:hypothetical protein